jgi:hypothetical protein
MQRRAFNCAGLGAATLVAGCASEGGSGAYVYHDWLYYHEVVRR